MGAYDELPTSDMTLQNPGFQRYIKRVEYNIGNLVLSGVKADNPLFLQFTEALASKLMSSYPSPTMREGACEYPFILDGWERLRTISGYKMDPLGLPVARYGREEDRPKSKAHEDLQKAIINEFFGSWRPEALSINKQSSSGPPLFSYDLAYKLGMYMLYADEADKIKRIISRRDWSSLRELGIWLTSAVTRRYQASDRVYKEGGTWKSKVREVTTFEGDRVEANKRTQYTGHFAMRSRLAVAFSATVGPFLNSIFNGYRSEALSKPCWHHTTPIQMAEKLNRYKHVICVDVKQFDQNNPKWALRNVLAALGRDWCDEVVQLAQTTLSCPFIINEDRVGGPGRYRWLGDPNDSTTYNLDIGLPSGVPYVAEMGKINGLWCNLLPALDLDMFNISELGSVMNCTHDRLCILNSGDDSVVAFTNEGDKQRYIEYIKAGQHPYFPIELEEPGSFLGLVLGKQGSTHILVPNLNSYLVNLLCRERGIQSRFNRWWEFGYWERKKYYCQHPAFLEVDAILQRVSKEVLGRSLDDQIPQGITPAGYDPLNVFNLMFMDKPERIYYQIQSKQISADLLDQFYLTVPSETVARVTKPWRKV
jgi:hypothetical protein